MDFILLGERIMLARRRLDLSQGDLSRMSGVTQRVISEIERGKRQRVAFATIASLAQALNLSLDELAAELQSAALAIA